MSAYKKAIVESSLDTSTAGDNAGLMGVLLGGFGVEQRKLLTDGAGDVLDAEAAEFPSRPREDKCRVVRRSRMVAAGEDMPPFLSTMDENGRPRYSMRKLRRNGRLEIAMVRNEDHMVLRRSFGNDGELKMEMVMVRCEEERDRTHTHCEAS